MTLQIQCRRCGVAFAPSRADIVRGDWRVCPGCRNAPTDDAQAGVSSPEAMNTPNTPDGPTDAPTSRTDPAAGQEAA